MTKYQRIFPKLLGRMGGRRAIAVTLLACSIVASASAQITVTGDYSPDEPFWSDGGGAQTGTIGENADGTLSIAGGSTVALNYAHLGRNEGATGTVTIEGSGSALTVQQILRIGYDGTGHLLLQNGGMISTTANRVYLGYGSGSVGTATVTGDGSQMSIKEDFDIGEYGTGTLRVEDGGYVLGQRFIYVGYRDGSVSSATVTGSGSELYSTGRMYTGLYGTGTLNVEAGGVVTVDDYAYLGHYGRDTDAGRGNGTANITGTGSEWNITRALFIGYWGDGELNVEDGASVTNTTESVLIGYAGVGVGTANIRGAGSELNASGAEGIIFVGYFGHGTLNIEDGATVTNRTTYIGARERSTQGRSVGTATVTGAGSQWNTTTDFVVGRGGTGSLTVENGGVVNNADGFIATSSYEETDDITYIGDGTATVTGSGSQWNNSGNLYVGYDGVGSLAIEDAGLVTSVDGYLGYNIGSSGTVVVSGADSQWINSGSLYVGSSGTGILSIGPGGLVTVTANDLSLGQGLGFGVNAGSDATLRLSIGDDGTGNITSGFIDAGGLFFGDGTTTLAIDVDAGTSVSVGYSFALLSYDSWDGNTFGNVGDGGILSSGGHQWRINYNAALGDGFGIVATAVPEPATCALAAGLLTALVAFIRRRRRWAAVGL